MGYLGKLESSVLELIRNQNGVSLVDIYEKLNLKKSSLSVHSLRGLLRRLVSEKKVVKTGIHQFRYYPPDSSVVTANLKWKNMFVVRPVQ